jgi:hypothetical protein
MTPRKPTAAPPVSPSPSRVEKVPVAAEKPAQPPAPATSDAEFATFIAKMKTLAPSRSADRGRLIFAMDATMSRAPTWDMALALQADMFSAVKEVGGLDVQLVYFRGMGECRASKWVSDPAALARLMTSVSCHGGLTQIGKVLAHALDESKWRKVNALVYVGDAMEERVDKLCARAGELALLGVPVFLFQEGDDSAAQSAFREIARLTKGAYCHFDRGSAKQLRELLTAVAVYAAGGRKALTALSGKRDGAGARLLLEQLGPAGR